MPRSRKQEGLHMYSPLPPCCAVPFFRRTCEDSSTCNRCGRFGFMSDWFDKNRGYVMLIAAFVSLFGCILQLISMLSISTRNSTVKGNQPLEFFAVRETADFSSAGSAKKARIAPSKLLTTTASSPWFVHWKKPQFSHARDI